MRAVYFRFVYSDKKPTGWIGMAVARNDLELFWAIDEFGDPYSVQIKEAVHGGLCVHTLDDTRASNYEVSEEVPEINKRNGWTTPRWPSLDAIYGGKKK